MLKIKKLTEVVGKSVYTSDGDFFGQVDNLNLVDNKIDGWKIRIGSSYMTMFGGARGVVIPHQFVRAVGDIIIVNKNSFPGRNSFEADASAPQQEEMPSFE